MSTPIKLVIVGATGQIGSILLDQITDQAIDFATLHLLASERSAGKRVACAGHHYLVEELADFDFKQCDVAVFLTPPAVSAKSVPLAVAAGCRVLDLSGYFLTDLAVPLLMADITDINLPSQGGSLHSLPGTVSQLLAPLLVRMVSEKVLAVVDVTALFPASAAGAQGTDELASQTVALLNAASPPSEVFPERLAFQLQTAGSCAQGSAHNALGQAAILSLKRLFGLNLDVDCRALFVPVFHGTTLSVTLECHEAIDQGRIDGWIEQAGIGHLVESANGASQVLCEVGSSQAMAQISRNPTRAGHKVSLLLSADNVYLAASFAMKTLQYLIRN